MIKVGIVGSRNFNDYSSFKAAVLKILSEWKISIENIIIISGVCKGTDKMAEKLVEEYHLLKEIYPVTREDYRLYKDKAYLNRNSEIVEASTYLIAFPSRNSRGTFDSINKAEKKGICKKVLFID